MPHLCVSLRHNLDFSSMHNSHMVVVQTIFRILKSAQITWSFIGHAGQALIKNSVGSNFPKKLQDPISYRNPLPPLKNIIIIIIIIIIENKGKKGYMQ